MLAPPHVLLPALLLVALALALDNPGESCRQAAGEFEGAKTDLQAVLQDYAKCVAASRSRR